HPRVPPRTPPAPAPVAAPSGALVSCLCAKSRIPSLSGNRAEMSLFEKPEFLRSLTILVACASDFTMQNTAYLPYCLPIGSLLRFHFELIVDSFHPFGLVRQGGNGRLLCWSLHWATEGDYAVDRNDF